MFRRTADHIWADVRNDAERAIEQAAILNFDERTLVIRERANAIRWIEYTPAAEQVGNLTLVGHDFDHIRKIANFLRSTSRVTAHHDDARVRISLRKLTNRLPTLGITLFSNGASVDDA